MKTIALLVIFTTASAAFANDFNATTSGDETIRARWRCHFAPSNARQIGRGTDNFPAVSQVLILFFHALPRGRAQIRVPVF